MPRNRDNDGNETKNKNSSARRHGASNGRGNMGRGSRPAGKGGWTHDGQSAMPAPGMSPSSHVAGGSTFSGS